MKVINLAIATIGLACAALPVAAQDLSSERLQVRTSGSNLNMRSEPFGRAEIVTSLENGTVVRNLGCRASGGGHWCQVSTVDGPNFGGWMSSRFLIESNDVAVVTPAESKNEDAAAPAANEAAAAPVATAPAAEAGKPAAAGEAGGSSEEQVQFAAGSNAATLRGALAPGESRRYVLNSDGGQNLSVQVTGTGSFIYYQILNPDHTFLLDQVASSVPYTGEFWQPGNHIVEIINRSDKVESYIANIVLN